MNQTKKTILLAVLFVLLLGGAAIGYNALSESYTPPTDGIMLPTPDDKKETDEAETSAAETVTETTAPETTAPETEPPLEPAPDFTVQTADGETAKLSDYVGKPVIINFWATWCGPCKSELPAFNDAYAAYGEDIHFLMVNLTDGAQETAAGVTEFVENNGYTFPLYLDTEIDAASTYGVYSIPLTVFVDAKGNLLGGHTGAMSYETLEQYIDILLTYYAEP